MVLCLGDEMEKDSFECLEQTVCVGCMGQTLFQVVVMVLCLGDQTRILDSTAHFSPTANQNPVKLFALETRLFELSFDSSIIKIGSETRELWALEFVPAAVGWR